MEQLARVLIPSASESWAELWRTLTGSTVAPVKHWGTLNLSLAELKQLTGIQAPFVNELDVPDCTTLAKDFTMFAKDNGIQLWPSGGGMGAGMSLDD